MKVLLIQPRNSLALNIYPPLSLIKIGTVLKERGDDVEIITVPTLSNYNYIDVIGAAVEKSDAVGITALTSELIDAIGIAKFIRKNFSVPIIWGGWHATLFPEQVAESKLSDAVIVDEGDSLITEVTDILANGVRFEGRGKIFSNKNHIDLNLLPVPDYSLVKNLDYYMHTCLPDKFLEYDKREVRWLPYEASRGCPSNCAFCINVVTNNRVHRRKSPEKVVVEIKEIVKKYAINHLKIIDDNFFVNREWVKRIVEALIELDLNITWDAECRVDYFNDRHVNDELLRLCVKSGLNELNFGIESGSQRSLDIMKKGITPEMSLYALKKSAEYGIVNRCSFIIDIPGEDKSDIYKTVELINKVRRIPKTTCGVHTYRPYPKSELCEDLLKEGLIEEPVNFEGWVDEKYIEQFTYADAKRKWQKNYKLSSKISFYQSLESGFWLRPHQIKERLVSVMNTLFMKTAKIRNRFCFYAFPIDAYFYIKFKNSYLKWKEKKTK